MAGEAREVERMAVQWAGEAGRVAGQAEALKETEQVM